MAEAWAAPHASPCNIVIIISLRSALGPCLDLVLMQQAVTSMLCG